MPTNELIATQLDPGVLSTCTNQLQNIINYLSTYSQSLTPEERQKYGSIHEQTKLLVGKVSDYHQQQPNLSSTDVDWPNFHQHWISRSGFAQLESLCVSIIKICSNARILHDFSLYQNALVDYQFTKYKAENTPDPGAYTTKYEELKQFFPNTGSSNTPPAEQQ